jgi:hypothetical protein
VLLSSTATQFFDPAQASVLPELAPDEELAAANTLMGTTPIPRNLLVVALPAATAVGLCNALLLPFALRALQATEFVYGLLSGGVRSTRKYVFQRRQGFYDGHNALQRIHRRITIFVSLQWIP